MFAKSFKVVDKQRFDLYVEEISLIPGEVIVKIETSAICKADLRYYLGSRDPKLLGLKYPLSLIHEAVGSVIKDPTNTFHVGQKVALCPNIINGDECSKHLACKTPELGENYCPDASFVSSSVDGFSKNYIAYKASNLIKLPPGVSNSVSVFSELISVAISSIRRIKINPSDTIAIWGDGILGYILSLTLSTFHKGKIIVVGAHNEKLEQFPTNLVFLHNGDLSALKDIDVAFECIGGLGSEKGIDQIINLVRPGAQVVLTGVSENKVSINTRKILEKGIALYGVTRSNVEDFKSAVKLFEVDSFCSGLEKLVLSKETINDITDYYHVFEKEKVNKKLGKYIMNYYF